METGLPLVLSDFLDYLSSVKSHSKNTVKEYSYDLVSFLKFIRLRKENLKDISFHDINIESIDAKYLDSITLQDMYAYIAFKDRVDSNGSAAKFRKVASIRAFYKYLYEKIKVVSNNPSYELEYPKLDKRLPIYLTLNDATKLLETVETEKNVFLKKRDFAIMMVFLNCGLRLSELVSLDVDSIHDDNSASVVGKGNKERIIFLNEATIGAINDYLTVRPAESLINDKDKKALFLSQQNNRISNRAVQHMIEKRVKEAGLSSDYTVHKLRHTAATLMYKYGDVDILTLKEVLGHSNVATTQIYTHLDNEIIKKATESNPLSNFNLKDEEK